MPPDSKPRVLVVDDNPSGLKLVRLVLESQGYDVFTAADAEEALATADDARPDLVLLDIQLPGMDGTELRQHLAQRFGQRGPPMLAMTAYAMRGDEERFLALGFDGYIAKPIDLQGLRKEVARHLESPADEARARP